MKIIQKIMAGIAFGGILLLGAALVMTSAHAFRDRTGLAEPFEQFARGLPGYDRRVAAVTKLPYATQSGEGYSVENSPPAVTTLRWRSGTVFARTATRCQASRNCAGTQARANLRLRGRPKRSI